MSEYMNLIIGLLATFVPLFVAGYLMLNRQPPIFRMFVAMLVIGVGYLWATGAVEDIGAKFTGRPNLANAPEENAVAPVPAAEKAVAPKPEAAPAQEKPAAEAPKAEPAPASATEAPKTAPPADAQPAGAH